MKHVRIFVLAFLFMCSPAFAQWQVPDNGVPIGRGGGNTGFDSAVPGTLGFPLKSNGALANPSFGQIVNGAITPGAANTAKGSLDGTSTVDLTLPSCAADGRHALTYTTGVGWVCTPTANDFTAVIPLVSTVTFTVGSPGIVGWTNGLPADNDVVYFCTTGTLLTGLTPCNKATVGTFPTDTLLSNPTLYYVVPGSQSGGNSFRISLTPGGPAINFSGVQSGTHTGYSNVFVAAGKPGERRFLNVPFNAPVSAANTPPGPDTVYATVPLTPGIWRIGGSTGALGTSGSPVFSTTHSGLALEITGICSSPFCGTTALHVTSNNSNGWIFTYDPQEIPVFSNSNLKAVCQPIWTGGGTVGCYGMTWAERIR